MKHPLSLAGALRRDLLETDARKKKNEFAEFGDLIADAADARGRLHDAGNVPVGPWPFP